MRLTVLGSGNARGVPVYGCDCSACSRARILSEHRRASSSALVESGGRKILLDAGLSDLNDRFPPGSLDHVLLTHYHMDHVYGLFHLRWGVNQRIPVIGPDDPAGCDDLLKHPGILDFSTKAQPLQSFGMADLRVTPLQLTHSRPTLGYHLLNSQHSLAYLTDTIGLPHESLDYLVANPPSLLVLDCSFPPAPDGTRNHNAVDDALAIHDKIKPASTLLTHIGHDLDCWLMDNADLLPPDIQVAHDGMTVVF